MFDGVDIAEAFNNLRQIGLHIAEKTKTLAAPDTLPCLL